MTQRPEAVQHPPRIQSFFHIHGLSIHTYMPTVPSPRHTRVSQDLNNKKLEYLVDCCDNSINDLVLERFKNDGRVCDIEFGESRCWLKHALANAPNFNNRDNVAKASSTCPFYLVMQSLLKGLAKERREELGMEENRVREVFLHSACQRALN